MKKSIINLLLIISLSTLQVSAQDSLVNLSVRGHTYPYWSPDGNFIVYQSNEFDSHDIFIMNADGTNRRRLTHDRSNNTTPTFSYDGEKIAFISDRDGDTDVYIMNLEGVVIDKITHNEHPDYHPSWSPNSQMITYGSGVDDDVEIYEFDLKSRINKRLTNNQYFDSFSAYSPDGNNLVYIKWLPNDNGELFMLDKATMKEKQLTDNMHFDGWPSWDHTGQYIYFSYANMNLKRYDIARVNIETLEIEDIVVSESHDQRPQVSPDGKWLLYNKWDEDGTDIYFQNNNY